MRASRGQACSRIEHPPLLQAQLHAAVTSRMIANSTMLCAEA